MSLCNELVDTLGRMHFPACSCQCACICVLVTRCSQVGCGGPRCSAKVMDCHESWEEFLSQATDRFVVAPSRRVTDKKTRPHSLSNKAGTEFRLHKGTVCFQNHHFSFLCWREGGSSTMAASFDCHASTTWSTFRKRH